jgi:hypothetical protein
MAPVAVVAVLVAGAVLGVVCGVVAVPVTVVPPVGVGVVVWQEVRIIPKMSSPVRRSHPIFRLILSPPQLIDWLSCPG